METKKKVKRGKSASPEDEYVVECIRDRKKEDGQFLYFIKWKDWPENTNTWEPESNLTGCTEMVREFNANFGKERASSESGSDKDVLLKKEKKSSTTTPSGSEKEKKLEKKKSNKRSKHLATKHAKKRNSDEKERDGDEDESEQMGKDKENTIDVDVLEELPEGKVPEELLGVVPIQGIMTYLIKWKSATAADDEEAEENGDEDPDMCLVKGEIFKRTFPLVVIDFYEKNIAWLRDEDRSEEDEADDVVDAVSDSIQSGRKLSSKVNKIKKIMRPGPKSSKRKLTNGEVSSASDSEASDHSAAQASDELVPEPDTEMEIDD